MSKIAGQHIHIAGEWTSGPNAGLRGVATDVRAGVLYATGPDGILRIGSPEDFRADTGESGDQLLEILLPWPHHSTLFQGAVRESLGAAHSVALIGQQDTRAWDRPNRYIVDDNEGNAAVVQFLPGACVSAASSHDAARVLDPAKAIVTAPAGLQDALAPLLDLPLLEFDHCPRITAVFWSHDATLAGHEPWFRTYLFGGEIFRRELMSDDAWRAESFEHYGLNNSISMTITQIVRRALPREVVVLTKEEETLLFPKDSKFRDEAIEQLVSGGVFMVPSRLF